LHGEQALVAPSHAGIALVHAEVFVLVHCTQRPPEHTGVAAGHGAAAPLLAPPSHTTHALPSHTGNA
jgi:hypothetical protein